MSDNAKARIRDAMRPARRPVQQAEAEDPLLAALPTDAPTQDDIEGWKNDPATVARMKDLRTKYLTAARQLIGGAVGSSDPKVAAIGGQLLGLRLAIEAMGGKV